MFDSRAAFFPKILPELAQRLCGRAHTALAHQLIELVCRRCNAIPKEKQRTNLTIEFLSLGEAFSQRVNIMSEFRVRSEEHTSELQSLMRISYAVFSLKNKNKTTSR